MALFTTGLWWFQGTGTLKLEPEVYVMVGEQRWDEISVWSKGTVCVETPRQERISKETGGDRKERQWVHTSQDWRAGAGCGSEGLLRLCCLCTRQLKTWQLCFKHVVSRVWGIKKYEKKKKYPTPPVLNISLPPGGVFTLVGLTCVPEGWPLSTSSWRPFGSIQGCSSRRLEDEVSEGFLRALALSLCSHVLPSPRFL